MAAAVRNASSSKNHNNLDTSYLLNIFNKAYQTESKINEKQFLVSLFFNPEGITVNRKEADDLS